MCMRERAREREKARERESESKGRREGETEIERERGESMIVCALLQNVACLSARVLVCEIVSIHAHMNKYVSSYGPAPTIYVFKCT
jgi:hypothetical protein